MENKNAIKELILALNSEVPKFDSCDIDNENFISVICKKTGLTRDEYLEIMGIKNLITEYCSLCETEQDFLRNIKEDGYVTICPNCKKLMFLCSMCSNVETGGHCDWDESTNSCCKLTPKAVLFAIAEHFEGTIEENSYGESVVSFFTYNRRRVEVRFEDSDNVSEKVYRLEIFCSESEAETELFKDNPVKVDVTVKLASDLVDVLNKLMPEF